MCLYYYFYVSNRPLLERFSSWLPIATDNCNVQQLSYNTWQYNKSYHGQHVLEEVYHTSKWWCDHTNYPIKRYIIKYTPHYCILNSNQVPHSIKSVHSWCFNLILTKPFVNLMVLLYCILQLLDNSFFKSDWFSGSC